MTNERWPLRGKVAVITGACTPIGLATAYLFAKRGARVVLAGSDGELLAELVEEIDASGADASRLVADVSKIDEAKRVAEHATALYERIDVWLNIPEAPKRGRDGRTKGDPFAMFDPRFWAIVNGSLVAVRCMRASGGAILNVADHVDGVRSFTAGLRRERDASPDGAALDVVLVDAAGRAAEDVARAALDALLHRATATANATHESAPPAFAAAS